MKFTGFAGLTLSGLLVILAYFSKTARSKFAAIKKTFIGRIWRIKPDVALTSEAESNLVHLCFSAHRLANIGKTRYFRTLFL
jgi:hypothetical protein